MSDIEEADSTKRRPATTVVSGLTEAIAGRHSARAFLADEVPATLVDEILACAARAPSGTNLQPWRVHVVRGAARDALVAAVCAAWDAQLLLPESGKPHVAEYDYYPREFFGAYQARRRKVGFDLYALLGIEKGDKLGMARQHRRNFAFFDAPVGLIFTIDRRMGKGSWLDYGMFLQNIMLLARAHGLDTCPQAAWIEFHRVIAAELDFAADEQLVCGMAVGYADPAAAANALRTERAALDEFRVIHEY